MQRLGEVVTRVSRTPVMAALLLMSPCRCHQLGFNRPLWYSATIVSCVPYAPAPMQQRFFFHMYPLVITSDEPVFCTEADLRLHAEYVESTIPEFPLFSQFHEYYFPFIRLPILPWLDAVRAQEWLELREWSSRLFFSQNIVLNVSYSMK